MPKCQPLFKMRQKGQQKLKKRNLDYNEIGNKLRKFCNSINVFDLSETGPFGTAAEALQWSNSLKNRKYLKLIWTTNRGNVTSEPTEDTGADYFCNDIDNSGKNEANFSGDCSPPTCNEPDKSSDKITRSTRKLRKRKLPYTPVTSKVLSNKKYCICEKNWDAVDSGKMVECQSCKAWYHCTCLTLPTLQKNETGKQIQFKCGRAYCNDGKFMYLLKGKSVTPQVFVLQELNAFDKCISEITQEAISLEQNISIFSGTTESPAYKELSEKLTRCLLRLDQLNIQNRNDLRSLRKSKVQCIQTLIDKLDSLVQNSETNCETKISGKDDEDTMPESFEVVYSSSEGSNSQNFVNPICPVVPQATPLAEKERSFQEPKQDELSQSHLSNLTENVCRGDSLDSVKNTKQSKITNFFTQTLSPLKSTDIADILHHDIPEYFTADIPQSTSFLLSADDTSHLRLIQNGRRYKKGQWQHVFVKGIKQTNNHCVFMFQEHRISSANIRRKKKNTPLFICKARCKFEDCPVEVILEMRKEGAVDVQYKGKIRHKTSHEHARPIRGTERDRLKEKFRDGAKPLKHFLEKFQEKETSQLVSGNFDGLGTDDHVYRQIATESRHIGRKDEDILKSLLKNMRDQKTEGLGFIQKISAKPCYILFWSEEGLTYYHKLASKSVLFWDATGSVVRKENGKQYLYYELALKHPVRGKMGIPVAAMVTEDQVSLVSRTGLQGLDTLRKKCSVMEMSQNRT